MTRAAEWVCRDCYQYTRIGQENWVCGLVWWDQPCGYIYLRNDISDERAHHLSQRPTLHPNFEPHYGMKHKLSIVCLQAFASARGQVEAKMIHRLSPSWCRCRFEMVYIQPCNILSLTAVHSFTGDKLSTNIINHWLNVHQHPISPKSHRTGL